MTRHRRGPPGSYPNEWPISHGGAFGFRGIQIANNQTALNDTTISIKCPATGALTILWGDGTSSAVACNGVLNSYVHAYAATGRYVIQVVGTTKSIADFRCYNQAWIGGSLAQIARGLGTSLVNLSLSSDPLLTGDLADLAGLTSLVTLYLHSDPLLTYTTPTALPPWPLCSLQLFSCGLSSGEVDGFLIDFADGCGAGPGAPKPLRLDGDNAARSAASNAAVATLTAAGWVVQANGP